MNELASWYAPLEAIRSAGSQSKRPGSLAGLHDARKYHCGQFFTPTPIVDLAWRIVTPAIDAWFAQHRGRIGLYDNSCGVGRFFWPADPDRFWLMGNDIDGAAVEALASAAGAAGFEHAIVNAGLEEMVGGRTHIALINPPFGLTLSSPDLAYVEGVTTWGRFGNNTAALSQLYAIGQALDVAEIVLAVVPSSSVEAVCSIPALASRLLQVLHLPAGSFREERTDVATALLVYGAEETAAVPQIVRLRSLDEPLSAVGLSLSRSFRELREPKVQRVDPSTPTITLPVSGDTSVWLSHDGRKLRLRYGSGLTQAKVANALLRRTILSDEHGDTRLPAGVRFHGQGWFDLENLLSTEDPAATFETLLQAIRGAGGDPIVTPTLRGYLARRIKALALQRTPLRRWAYVPGRPELSTVPLGQRIAAEVVRSHAVDVRQWGGPVLRKGERIELEAVQSEDGRVYRIHREGATLGTVLPEQVADRYLPDLPAVTGWRLVHPGRAATFPEQAAAVRRRAEASGAAAFLSWDFQLADAVELALSRRGVYAGEMGTGKTRLAFGLCLIGGGAHNLIAAEAHVIAEFVDEAEKIGIDKSLWQVISCPADLDSLKRINLISYGRLRREVVPGAGRRTYARLLRRRIHSLVADEGHLLRNRQTHQCRALWAISPKCRFGMSGTPIANYVRDALPLIVWAGGDGIATQPYGERQPYIDPRNLATMAHSRRGLDVFAERFVTVEWAVREFTEDLRTGAKREVPRLRSVESFREAVAPHILRRVAAEPELAPFLRIPVPTRHLQTVDWEPGHLRTYLEAAWEFAAWYRRVRACDGPGVNLVALLARLGEVHRATNLPHTIDSVRSNVTPFHGITTKQRAGAALLERFTTEGRKSLLFATNPASLARMAGLLADRGIDMLQLHGGVPVAERARLLRSRFRQGSVPVVGITYGAGQTGLNIPEASRVCFLDRAWTPKTENQAGGRVLRPQQREDVEFWHLHLRGSLDEYQAMLCEHKQDACDAGLDYGESTLSEGDFLHLDTVIGRFVDQLADRWGVDHHRDVLDVLRSGGIAHAA